MTALAFPRISALSASQSTMGSTENFWKMSNSRQGVGIFVGWNRFSQTAFQTDCVAGMENTSRIIEQRPRCIYAIRAKCRISQRHPVSRCVYPWLLDWDKVLGGNIVINWLIKIYRKTCWFKI